MSDLKLFDISKEVRALTARTVAIEKDLQTLIEKNMFTFFGVHFLISEFTTTHGGRIDSLGVDENNCPVIFEYKRTSTENVINQGLFYLDWLFDHKEAFELLVMKKLGNEYSEKLDWSMPRLICIAADFTRYDEYAVKQINRNISLIRYKKFDEQLILFELVNSMVVKPIDKAFDKEQSEGKKISDRTFLKSYSDAPEELKNLYEIIKDYILSLGDDITENQLKIYVAFKKIKNFICAEFYSNKIVLHLRLNPKDIILKEGFIKDKDNTSYFGAEHIQITIKNIEDFENAKVLIDRAYTEN